MEEQRIIRLGTTYEPLHSLQLTILSQTLGSNIEHLQHTIFSRVGIMRGLVESSVRVTMSCRWYPN